MKGDVIISPLSTEKTALMAEKENKLTLIVRREANKEMIKKEVEERFGVKVEEINVLITKKGKKAIVKLAKEFSAEEIAERIGVF
ncbi:MULTISPECIES: 50S ribosomal protein L23 [unclassified Thermoplasma]|uniref:50S ribosomal protein L23 n=1 Tax=unclassified Thermoplasma TaxID=2684908 RepID=UPI000D990114|nr:MULTISPECIES: 50S ribosomal protein L23 [unclassified Thermoplasma]PYB67721.1 50S ribosomal protein L23 [Thermoplasma sp. Kam2015]